MRSLLTLIFLTQSALAAQVLHAQYDRDSHSAVIDVVYGGGCGDHQFDLKIVPLCLESYPSQANAQLIHHSNDPCEALIQKRIHLDLSQYQCGEGILHIEDSHGENTQIYID
jgi:hypothetical protein